MNQRSDPDARVDGVLMLYGATMLAVQGVEDAVAWLQLVANTDPHKVSKASIERQWRAATERHWKAFQKNTARANLKQLTVGVEAHIDEALYAELDKFLRTRRNQLAHRFLVERIQPTPDGAGRFARGTVSALLGTTMAAGKLSRRLHERANEIRATWPEQPEPPAEVQEYAALLARMTTRKEFPASMRSRDSRR